MMIQKDVSPLTKERAFATIKVVANAVLAGQHTLTYSDLSHGLGMAKLNRQGLTSYLHEAAAICAKDDWPTVSVLVVSAESREDGTPMPPDGSFKDGLFLGTALTKADIPAEQDRVRAFDWRNASGLDLA